MSGRLGTLIRLRREELRLSMRECAARVGVSAAHWCDIEHGRRFPSKLEPYADALGVPLPDLSMARLEDRPVPTDLEMMVRRIVREEIRAWELRGGGRELVFR